MTRPRRHSVKPVKLVRAITDARVTALKLRKSQKALDDANDALQVAVQAFVQLKQLPGETNRAFQSREKELLARQEAAYRRRNEAHDTWAGAAGPCKASCKCASCKCAKC